MTRPPANVEQRVRIHEAIVETGRPARLDSGDKKALFTTGEWGKVSSRLTSQSTIMVMFAWVMAISSDQTTAP